MSLITASKKLSDLTNFLFIPTNGNVRYIAILRLAGTFVATVKVQKSTDYGKTWADLTVIQVANSGATAANPTATGTYASDAGATNVNALRVIISAYTSGEVQADVSLVPFQA